MGKGVHVVLPHKELLVTVEDKEDFCWTRQACFFNKGRYGGWIAWRTNVNVNKEIRAV